MKKILITGCAGFIGFHLSKHFINQDEIVFGIDNLSRKGSSFNAENLKQNKNFIFENIDIRDYSEIISFFKKNGSFDLVIHEAAQVAVTTSLINPREDFEINALGTFNMLEATRHYSSDAVFIFASTNKVYGKMSNSIVIERNSRYEYEKEGYGVNELQPLDFHSPYGCSKGSADQYVTDYSKIYGLKTIVLRQSCIYGTRQFGIEDQGWVAWFVIAAILNKRITIYGDGKQTRDLLWIDDLVEIYQKIFENSKKTSGNTYNVGGGYKNLLSINQLLEFLTHQNLINLDPLFSEWRDGDQKTFVCDNSKLSSAIKLDISVTPEKGVMKLIDWAISNKDLLKKILNG